jgi:hypothetical protein
MMLPPLACMVAKSLPQVEEAIGWLLEPFQ